MYKITQQYGRGSEAPLQSFKTLNEAKSFIVDKMQSDAAMKIKVFYRIYEGMDLLEEFDPDKVDLTRHKKEDSSSASSGSAGGKGSGATFKPTPFNVSPRPAGMPHNWVKDGDDKDKEDKSS